MSMGLVGGLDDGPVGEVWGGVEALVEGVGGGDCLLFGQSKSFSLEGLPGGVKKRSLPAMMKSADLGSLRSFEWNPE